LEKDANDEVVPHPRLCKLFAALLEIEAQQMILVKMILKWLAIGCKRLQ
jgi:hypothetical protein